MVMTNAIVGEIRYDPDSDNLLLRAARHVAYDWSGALIVNASYVAAPNKHCCVVLERWRALPLVVIGETRRSKKYRHLHATLVRVNDGGGVVVDLSGNVAGAIDKRVVGTAADWFGLFEVEPVAAPVVMDMKRAFRLAREHHRPKAHYDDAFIDDPIALPPEPAAANRCPRCGGTDDVYVGLNVVEHACPEVVCPLEVRPWYSSSRRETEYRATRGWSVARPCDGARLFDERGPTREHAIAALRAAERAAGLFAEGDE
jgi:hypothetical protein